jgi:hypothetical protein
LHEVKRPLPRFVVATLAWLPAAFAVWYLAAPVILWPAYLLARVVLVQGFADVVQSVEASGAVMSVLTRLRPGQAIAGGTISVDVNLLLYAFGLPMYAALVLGAREPGWPAKLAIGYAVLLPFVAFGAVADALKSVALTAGPTVASQTGFSPFEREAIAFAYQFGSLILPTVVPAATWVLTHRAFLERMRGASLPQS